MTETNEAKSAAKKAVYPEKLAELVETFALLDRGERIETLIGLADRFEEVPPEVARRPFPAASKVPACESEAFVFAAPRPDGKLDLHFAVENPQGLSAKAMAVILGETLRDVDPADYAELPGELPLEIFGRELSMGKNMGLMGMVALVAHSARRAAAGARPDGRQGDGGGPGGEAGAAG